MLHVVSDLNMNKSEISDYHIAIETELHAVSFVTPKLAAFGFPVFSSCFVVNSFKIFRK